MTHLHSFTSSASVTVNMSWHSFRVIMTSLLEGSPFAIAVTALIAFGLPVLLHFIFYRAVASPPRSNFLLLGPAGAGKTALLSLVRPALGAISVES
jgi:signal recognition particle receptor subunit beta